MRLSGSPHARWLGEIARRSGGDRAIVGGWQENIPDWRETMNCWHCEEELVWGGAHDCVDSDEFSMETNLSCPKCHSLVIVYMSKRWYSAPMHDAAQQ